MSSSRAGPVPSRIAVRSMITVTNLSPAQVCRHTCSSTPSTATPSNLDPGRRSALGGFRPGRRRSRWSTPPGDPQRSGAPSGADTPALPTRTATQPATASPAARCPTEVLARHMPAGGAPVAARRDQGQRRPPPRRQVRQPSDHAVPRLAFTAAAATPRMGVDHPAGEHRPIALDRLPGDFQAELVGRQNAVSPRQPQAGSAVPSDMSRSSRWAARQNLHHRKTSTLTPPPTRRPLLHRQL